MATCPVCGEKVSVHETERYDEMYCMNCSHEERIVLDRPRPMKPIERDTPQSGWRQDISKQASHPARKGYREKRERDKQGK